jgi:hypothetical protein
MKKVIGFSDFLNEGGQAIKSSRRIRESEAEKTIDSITEKLLPLLGNPKRDEEYIVIGSIGKKKNPDDTSGDIDLGISSAFVTNHFNVSPDFFLETVFEVLKDELPEVLGTDDVEIKMMKGINVISIGWPIEGEFSNGTVQLDIIPISDMDWARFIFYSPDYRIAESKYKSAHRNWLFQAILSALKEPKTFDENGEVLDFDTYAIRLNDGVYKNSKTYKGATKRLKNPQTVPGQSIFITRDPKKLLAMLFGPDVKENEVKTFEDVWKIVTSPNFIYSDKLEKIKENLVKYLTNGGFEIPSEIIL